MMKNGDSAAARVNAIMFLLEASNVCTKRVGEVFKIE